MSISVISRPDNEKDLFVYRFPLLNSNIKYGSELLVKEDEAAILVKDGIAFDVFPTGNYTLSKQNTPKLSQYLDLKNHSKFTCEVYFISLYTYQNIKWAMVNSLVVRDNTFGSISIRASGNFSFKVYNVSLFMTSLLGKITTFNYEDITSYLRNIVVIGITNMITSTRITALDFYTNYPKFTLETYKEVVNAFNSVGLILSTLEVEDVTIPEETEKLLKIKILEHANLTEENIVNGRLVTDNSYSPSNGLSPNHPINAGTLLSSEMKKMFNMVQDLTITCVHCGSMIAKNFNYCPQCGKQNKESIKECPNCHNIVAFRAKYCPDCGSELFDKDTAIICKNCGKLIKDHEKFCPDCGKPV